jgi:hypothetical protein
VDWYTFISIEQLKKYAWHVDIWSEGRISEHGYFIQDWDLAGLRDYEPYRKLIGLN